MATSLLVLEALTGRTYELECTGATRVEAVTSALTQLSGLQPEDQILTLGAARLEPARALSTYGLPAAGDAGRVFLYSRASLRPGAPPPPPEAPPALPATPPAPPEPAHAPSDAPPEQRTLPFYAAQFAWHAATGRALMAAMQAKLAVCARLVGEVHVQALAVDSARENVDVHFAYICRAHSSFERRFAASHGAASAAVDAFEPSLQRCSAAELHPQVQARWARAAAAAAAAAAAEGDDVAAALATPATLADLFPRERLRRAAAEGGRGRDALAAKAAELAAALAALQSGTEALFMAGPACDVAQLQTRLQGAAAHAERAAAAAAALDGDAETARRLAADGLPFEDAAAGGAGPGSASVAPLGAADACAALEAMHARHRSGELATLRAAEASVSALLTHAAECKAAMTRGAAAQLADVAALQSGIRALRNRQAALGGAAAALGDSAAELARLAAAPGAYAAALAEAARRRAASAALAAAAGAAAERLAAARGAEAAARDAFRASPAAAALPPGLARAMGLEAPPPSVEVSLRATDAALVPVSDDDVRRLSAQLLSAAAAGAWTATSAGATSASSGSSSGGGGAGAASTPSGGGAVDVIGSSPPKSVQVPPQLPRSPKRGVGASIAHALQRRASGGSSLLGALVGAATSPSAMSASSPRPPSPALRRSNSGIEAPAPPPAMSPMSLDLPALDTAASPPDAASPGARRGLAAENAALRAELTAAVATLAAAAAGAPAAGGASASAALAAALEARDAVAEALRADLEAARAESEALRVRCSQLEAALEAQAGCDAALEKAVAEAAE